MRVKKLTYTLFAMAVLLFFHVFVGGWITILTFPAVMGATVYFLFTYVQPYWSPCCKNCQNSVM